MAHVFQEEIDKILDQYLEGKLNTDEVRLLHTKLQQGDIYSIEREDSSDIELPDDIRFPLTNAEKASNQLLYTASGRSFEINEGNYLKFMMLNGRSALFIAIVFTLLLLVPFLYLFMSLDKKQNLIFKYFSPHDISSSQRIFDDPQIENEWNVIALKYRSGNYSATLLALNQLYAHQLPDVYIDRFYMGICYIALNEPSNALEHLNAALVQSRNDGFVPYIKWYISLAYLQNGNNDVAKTMLSDLAQLSDFAHFKKDKQLLSEL